MKLDKGLVDAIKLAEKINATLAGNPICTGLVAVCMVLDCGLRELTPAERNIVVPAIAKIMERLEGEGETRQ